MAIAIENMVRRYRELQSIDPCEKAKGSLRHNIRRIEAYRGAGTHAQIARLAIHSTGSPQAAGGVGHHTCRNQLDQVAQPSGPILDEGFVDVDMENDPGLPVWGQVDIQAETHPAGHFLKEGPDQVHHFFEHGAPLADCRLNVHLAPSAVATHIAASAAHGDTPGVELTGPEEIQ